MLDTGPLTKADARTRIVAFRDGEIKPLYDSTPFGPCSPSPSLLIERHELPPSNWQTVIIPEQILTLHLRRSEIECEHSSGTRLVQTCVRGGVAIEKRGCAHKWRRISEGAAMMVRLSDSVLELASQSATLPSDDVPADSAAKDIRLSSLMFNLERERMRGFPSGRLFVDGIEQALAAILVHYHGVAQRASRVYKGGLAPYRMKRAIEFIRAHIEEEITLSELAKDVGLSPSHFCSLFRKTSGMTPHQFVLNCRIQHAKTLLSKSGNSILDVALASGFRTHQHFSRIFRRHVGIPPSAYRSQL